MRDKIAERRTREARDRFIESINQDDILRLASAHHGGEPCTFFKPLARGTYNVCYFVRFGVGGSESGVDGQQQEQRRQQQQQQQGDGNGGVKGGDGAKNSFDGEENGDDGRKNGCGKNNGYRKDVGGDSWVVRVPLDPYLCIPAYEKVESEVAVMQLIASKTTIPIPKLHAYSIARKEGPFGIASYIILEYVEGTMLNMVNLRKIDEDKRRNLYTQLADIFIQLRRFEFPAIGRLAPSSDGGVEVRRRPITNHVNLQVVEGLRPLEIMEEYCHKAEFFTSANDYVSMLLRLAWNAYEFGKTKTSNDREAGSDIYNLDMFSVFVRTRWLDPVLDKGPFIFEHGDFGPYNIMVNEKLDILAVLDWEWSRTVPRQFFLPPEWLSGRHLGGISLRHFFNEHVNKLDTFRAILRDREQKLCGKGEQPPSPPLLLSEEWAHIHEDAGILIPRALESWTFIDLVAEQYLDKFLGGTRSDRPARIDALIAARPDYRALVAKKVEDTMAYRAQMMELGIEDSDDEEEEAGTNDEVPLCMQNNRNTEVLHNCGLVGNASISLTR